MVRDLLDSGYIHPHIRVTQWVTLKQRKGPVAPQTLLMGPVLLSGDSGATVGHCVL